MKIHEYQGKAILRTYELPVPQGEVARLPLEARQIAETLGGQRWVVKAQIHAGGRGKSGGIRLARSPAEVEQHAAALLGQPLVTPQTGPGGQLVQCVLIEEGCEIAQELYCSIVIDRQLGQPVCLLSAAGGMDIETVAATAPATLMREPIDVLLGLAPFQARRLVERLQLQPAIQPALASLLPKLYTVFRDKDCTLLEINPLIVTSAGGPLCLDVKMECDDNALFRQPEVEVLRDLSAEEPLEVEATHSKLNYIKLAGNIGCIVNGAGLAMATMDIIQQAGASPANFLDVGGRANAGAIEQAFRIIMADPHVQAVLINVFGGILRCDIFAQGVLQAVTNVQVRVPVVVRMEGTNVEEGRQILAASGLQFRIANDMAEAAQHVVQAIRE
ncbi:MAG: ADP-forming succinate--CoA ligase subunit beta [Candidatus Tectomicrobia bacterium]|uniref:Succinate--CoA ligase [ADP-forming] subunit beta n=1 Tax=Tectimicrobiota bacterium TaxID=2528274 RepID=A0A938B3X6_UNCTE|nr:ADP-forming succinate--CoA ligase subunit beta [Candidatus Tectomicrobia bacterium]